MREVHDGNAPRLLSINSGGGNVDSPLLAALCKGGGALMKTLR